MEGIEQTRASKLNVMQRLGYPDLIFRGLIIGAAHVGKTTLVNHLMGNPEFPCPSSEEIKTTTQGREYLDHKIKLEFNDVPSSITEPELSHDFLFLVYDQTNPESFEYIKKFLPRFLMNNTKPAYKLVVCNKSEGNKVVDPGTVKEWAQSNGCYFTEISCTTKDGVDKLNDNIIPAIIDNFNL